MPRLALGTTDGPLLYRIQRLIGTPTHAYSPSRLPGILALCLGLACFAFNMNWARAQAPETHLAEPAARGVQVDLGGASVMHVRRSSILKRRAKTACRVLWRLKSRSMASGNVSDARVLSGPSELRKGALQSVLQWHFTHDVAGSTRHDETLPEPAAGIPLA